MIRRVLNLKAQHVASVCMESQQCWHLLTFVASSLKTVKNLGPCKRMQHCWPKAPNNTQQCCDLLRPFAWALLYLTTHQLFMGSLKRTLFIVISERHVSNPCYIVLYNMKPSCSCEIHHPTWSIFHESKWLLSYFISTCIPTVTNSITL